MGDGTSGALIFGGNANIFTKVGGRSSDYTIAAMINGRANIFTHIGDGTSVALMANSSANIFTKVGDGLTVGLMQGEANVMTHVGSGMTIGLAKAKANIITKVGNGTLVAGLYSDANIVTHISNELSNTFALLKGKANVITKVGPLGDFSVTIDPVNDTVAKSQEDAQIFSPNEISTNPMSVVKKVYGGMKDLITNSMSNDANGNLNALTVGDANIITHIGKGATNIAVHGKANVINKVGNGKSFTLANGEANILKTVGDGDSIQTAKGRANIITKVGSGVSGVVAIGEANVVTKVGDGLHVGIMHGKANVQTIVGDGLSVTAQNGKLNLNTRVGKGTNVSVARGKLNVNIQFGDGLGVYAAAGRGNISIKIGSGDYYGFALETGGPSLKERLESLLQEMKSTAISVLAGGTISAIVNGEDSGTITGHGHTIPTIETPGGIDGFSISQTEDTTDTMSANDYVTQGDTVDATFENQTNVSVNANNIVKRGNRAWNAGAFSKQTIDTDGSVSTLIDETNTHRMFGVSANTDGENTNVSFNKIDHAIYLRTGGRVQIYENGLNKGDFGSYAKNDKMEIKRVANVITYLKNDVVFYTSETQSSGKLYVDVSLETNDATLKDIQVTNEDSKGTYVTDATWNNASPNLSIDNNIANMKSYDHQIIVVMEGEDLVKNSAYKLALKHPHQSSIIMMDKNGNTTHLYGKSIDTLNNISLRITAVGHGREKNGAKTLAGRSAEQFATQVKNLKGSLAASVSIDRVSLLGCNLGEGHNRLSESDYGKDLMLKLKNQGIHTTVSIRNAYVAIAADGRKGTSATAIKDSWFNNVSSDKTVYKYENGVLVSGEVAESGNVFYANDIDNPDKKVFRLENSNRLVEQDKVNLNNVDFNDIEDTLSDDNITPENPNGNNTGNIGTAKIEEIDSNIEKIANVDQSKRPTKDKFNEAIQNSLNDTNEDEDKPKNTSIGGNIQINVGDGEHNTLYYGQNNIDVKIGDGGHKTAMFGDRNALISIGNALDGSPHTVEVGNYTAFEGAQLLVGQHNLAFNHGVRNDFIVMNDKSIPIIPLLNPFDGATAISATLKQMKAANADEQEVLWSFDKTKTFADSMSVLDLTSTVEYGTLLDVGSENDVSDRGIRYDLEASLNNAINGAGSKAEVKEGLISKIKNAPASVKNSSINISVAGEGSDIVLANGNFSFIFGDNVQSALDTTVASFFGVMQQGFTATGAPTKTWTFSPNDLRTQLGNDIKNRLAQVTGDITIGELLNLNYSNDGHIYSKEGQNIDGGYIVKELFTTILKDSYSNLLDTLSNPKKIINEIKATAGVSGDVFKNGLKGLGLPIDTDNTGNDEEFNNAAPANGSADDIEGSSFGFSGLTMPSFFDVLKIPSMLTKIPTLVEDLANTLTDDVGNMKDKMLTFFTDSGYMRGDGDLITSIGSQNFVWGGHGKDLIALMGVNNNVWAGSGDDVGYLIGEGNTFSGNTGNDSATMIGQNHMFIGGAGDDFAVASGRYNNLFGGAGNDQLWAFGTRGLITGGDGDDYMVSTGNNHDINAGAGNDFSVSIGSGHKIALEAGHDQAKLFGNKNHLLTGEGKDTVDIHSYDSVIQTDNGNDTIMARAKSKGNEIHAGSGNDTIFIGGLNNTYSGGDGDEIFVMTKQNIDGTITDIDDTDILVFDNFSYTNLWFEKSLDDLIVHSHNNQIDASSGQNWFEEFGALKVDNYFEAGNRARIVTSAKTNDAGNIEYEYLDNNVIDKLVEIMATEDKVIGNGGFMTGKSTEFQNDVSLAWSQRTDATRIIA